MTELRRQRRRDPLVPRRYDIARARSRPRPRARGAGPLPVQPGLGPLAPGPQVLGARRTVPPGRLGARHIWALGALMARLAMTPRIFVVGHDGSLSLAHASQSGPYRWDGGEERSKTFRTQLPTRSNHGRTSLWSSWAAAEQTVYQRYRGRSGDRGRSAGPGER